MTRFKDYRAQLTRPQPGKDLRELSHHCRRHDHPHDATTTVRDVLADYLEIVEVVEPLEIPHVVRDPDDDHVLARALAAKANLIVSGDKDLLDLPEYQGIPILTPGDAQRRIEIQK